MIFEFSLDSDTPISGSFYRDRFLGLIISDVCLWISALVRECLYFSANIIDNFYFSLFLLLAIPCNALETYSPPSVALPGVKSAKDEVCIKSLKAKVKYFKLSSISYPFLTHSLSCLLKYYLMEKFSAKTLSCIFSPSTEYKLQVYPKFFSDTI